MELERLLELHAVRAAVAEIVRRGPGALPAALGKGGPRADLVAGMLIGDHPGLLFPVVEAWLAAHGHQLPRRAGHAPPEVRVAGVYLGEKLRDAVAALVSRGPLRLRDREEFLVVYLWRQIFLNAYSPLNLFGPPPPAAAPGAGWLTASLAAPFDAPVVGEAEGLFERGDLSLAEKLVVACWLVNLPEIGLTRAAGERCVANVVGLCRGALRAIPPGLAFTVLVDEAMTGLFRAAYAGCDTLAGLSALGDLAAAGAPAFAPGPPPADRPARPRARLGYVSSSFRAHSVAYYMANRILHRDRERYEVILFSIGGRRDGLTDEMARAGDELVPLPAEVGKIAAAIRARDVDLLIFADLGMDATTHLLASLRLAPRQIALMGHAATSGLPTLSHYIGGDHEGPAADGHYRERLVRLPHLGAAQLAPVAGDDGTDWRRSLGIPEGAVVLISLANGIKLLPERDRLLVEILERAPRAYVVLKPFFDPSGVDERLVWRLQGAAAARGVEGRLKILPPLRTPGALPGLLAAADVQLDSYPFGGWTSNLDALHAGLPMVTQVGELGRSRWGAAFLRDLGIEEGIARDEREYVDWAVKLAEDAPLRARLRARIEERARGLFFDGAAAQPAYEAALASILAHDAGPWPR